MIDTSRWPGPVYGKIGNLIFARRVDGRIVVKRKPHRKAPFTAAELSNQTRFSQASAYARMLKASPEQFAIYQRAGRSRGKRGCDLAVADFLKPPVIERIELQEYTGQPGQTIWIAARDDLEVVRVLVVISDLSGRVLENAAAVLEPGDGMWKYVTSKAVAPGQTLIIRAGVADHAGNTVTLAAHHALLPV